VKAVVLRGVNDLRLEDLPDPRPKADEALVKIRLSGVCGTDVHMWEGKNFEGKFPFVPGHEWVGDVVETGAGVTTLKKGDRVTGECFIPCGTCPVCQNGGEPAFCKDHEYYGFAWETAGGMAEYHVSPARRLHKIPPNMSDEEGALVEPVSVAYHSIWGRGGGVAPHDTVAVFGAGPIGLFAIQVAKVAGAKVIAVEPMAERQRMAREIGGADEIVDPSKDGFLARMSDLTDGLGCSLVIECSGSKAGIASTVEVAGVHGRIVLTGQAMGVQIPAELGKMIWKHATIAGACGSPFFFPKTIVYMSRGLVDFKKIVTNTFPLAEARTAFELGKKAESGKIMLRP